MAHACMWREPPCADPASSLTGVISIAAGQVTYLCDAHLARVHHLVKSAPFPVQPLKPVKPLNGVSV